MFEMSSSASSAVAAAACAATDPPSDFTLTGSRVGSRKTTTKKSTV